MSQSKVFLDSEGDKWFERNRKVLETRNTHYETELIKKTLTPFKNDINQILEIGCGNGDKLYDLGQFFNAKGSGIDPSSMAITDGIKKYGKTLDLQIATAESLTYKDNEFDFVYFGFCLYLVDRAEIFRVIAEADRVLKKGGFLAILDFDPSKRHKRPYHHKEGLFSYKNNYTDFFTASGHYYLVAKESISIAGGEFAKNPDDRASINILYKEVDPY